MLMSDMQMRLLCMFFVAATV